MTIYSVYYTKVFRNIFDCPIVAREPKEKVETI